MKMTENDPRLAYWQQHQQANLMQHNLIQFQLDAGQELEILKEDLLGLEYDDEGNLITDPKIKTRRPLISQHGANVLLSFLRPRITKIISLSNLPITVIEKRCHQYADDVTYLLHQHREEFEIQSTPIMDNIIDLCDDLLHSTYMKSLDAGERDTLRKQFTMVESQERIQDNRQTQKSPFSNPLLNMRQQ